MNPDKNNIDTIDCSNIGNITHRLWRFDLSFFSMIFS